jgi:HEAT repeat protein
LGEIAVDRLAPQYQDRILQALIAALDDSVYQSIRTKAIRALAQTDDRHAVAPLKRLQHNGTLEDQREVGWALERLLKTV